MDWMNECDCPCDDEGTCYELTHCQTEEVVVTGEDLSEFSVGDVIVRDPLEGGGCWELTDVDVTCSSTEEFTPDGEPYLLSCWSGVFIDTGTMEEFPYDIAFDDGTATLDWDCTEGAYQETDIEVTYLGGGEWRAEATLSCGPEVVMRVVDNGDGSWTGYLSIDSVELSGPVAVMPSFGDPEYLIASSWDLAMGDFPAMEDCCTEYDPEATINISFNLHQCEEQDPCENCLENNCQTICAATSGPSACLRPEDGLFEFFYAIPIGEENEETIYCTEDDSETAEFDAGEWSASGTLCGLTWEMRVYINGSDFWELELTIDGQTETVVMLGESFPPDGGPYGHTTLVGGWNSTFNDKLLDCCENPTAPITLVEVKLTVGNCQDA